MGRNNLRERITVEWARRHENVGVITTYPEQIIQSYIDRRSIGDIFTLFWRKGIETVNLMDICAYTMYWWIDKYIIAARNYWFKHPKHHSSEYIFDRSKLRMIISIRQPDLDGKHWKLPHIYLIIGEKVADCCGVKYPKQNKHIKLVRPEIDGKYICRVK